MKKLLAYAGCLLLVATTLTACGSGGGTKDSVRVAVGGDVEFLDPAIVDDSVTANILAQTYEGLYKLDKDGNPQPQLAEAMPEISADGLKYTIKIKKDVKWSDGEPLKASDFVYAWNRAAAYGGADAYYSMFISQYIAGASDLMKMGDENFGAVAKDDNTIEITLKEPSPYFTALLTNTVFYPVRKDFVEKDNASPIKSGWADLKDAPTNGAFKFSNISSKDIVELVPNENYYDKDKVQLKGISFKVMSEPNAEVSAFVAGEIDFATAVNMTSITSDEKLQKQLYKIDPMVVNYYVLINAGDENANPALKDPEIRKAINQSIDRSAILKVIGYGDLAYELKGLIPSGIPGASGDFRGEADEKGALAEQNLESAKKIMESKGYSADKPLKLTYSFNDTTMHKDVAQAMQASMKAAHIDVTLKTSELQAFFKARDTGDFEICRHAMTADFIDPMAYLSMYIGKTTAGNTVDDAKFEEMVAKANKLTDKAERMNALHEAESYLVKEQNYIAPLFGYTDPILKAADLDGVTSSPEGHYDLRFASWK